MAIYQLKNTSDCIKIDLGGLGRNLKKKNRKNDPKCWVFFCHSFFAFFQIPSRTWGINFDTIACVFELVDGQKKCLIFSTIFPEKIFFRNIFFGPIHSFPTPRGGRKNISKIFIFSSYPTLFYPPPKNYFFNCVPSISFLNCV